MTLRSRMRTGLVAGAGLAVMLGASMATAADYTLKLNHVAGANTPVQVCSEVMEGYMERMSNNRFDVQVYPAAQLGNFRQSVESVQLGSLELTFTTGGGIANLFGPIQAFDIPYLLKNDRVVNRVMEDAELNKVLGDDILSALKTVRMVGMSGNHGWRSFFIDKGPTANLPQDWQGKKIRTIESPISMELARAVGLSPDADSLAGALHLARHGHRVRDEELADGHHLDGFPAVPQVPVPGSAHLHHVLLVDERSVPTGSAA